MKDDFATAMRRSFKQTCTGNPFAATRTMQAALAGSTTETPPASVSKPKGKAARRAKPVTPRRRLSEDLSRLPPGPDSGPDRAPPALEVTEGALFEPHRHEGGHGVLDYRLFVPSDRDAGIQGVILMLHGCTQGPEDFATGTRMNEQAERHGLVVVYPAQTRGQNPSACWNWFRPGDQGRSGGEAALLADMVTAIADEHGVPPARVFAAGLSAGGAMAAILAQSHPEVFAAAGVHSGLAPGSASNAVSALGAMRGDPVPGAEPLRAPAIIFHGSADGTVAPVNAGRIAGPLVDAEARTGEAAGRRYDVLQARNPGGNPVEVWRIEGAGHAWSGGHADGSYTDPKGPDASAEMVRFFLGQA